jgi:Transcriptional regulator
MDRNTIRTKALGLFNKISFAKTSVSDIAKACDMGKGTFYLYYESKDEIFSHILEERILTLKEMQEQYFNDPSVALPEKIRRYFETLVDEYFVIKDLLFGSFDNVQGQTVKEVFFKFSKHYQMSIQLLFNIVDHNSHHDNPELLREQISELMELMVGRMLTYIMIHEWNDREGLKQVISPLSEKLYGALVA